MFNYDFYDDNLSSVAQSCRHLSPKAAAGRAGNAAEGISCNICSNWDGRHCTRTAYDNVMTKLGLD